VPILRQVTNRIPCLAYGGDSAAKHDVEEKGRDRDLKLTPADKEAWLSSTRTRGSEAHHSLIGTTSKVEIGTQLERAADPPPKYGNIRVVHEITTETEPIEVDGKESDEEGFWPTLPSSVHLPMWHDDS
jgi:hypothetical protein